MKELKAPFILSINISFIKMFCDPITQSTFRNTQKHQKEPPTRILINQGFKWPVMYRKLSESKSSYTYAQNFTDHVQITIAHVNQGQSDASAIFITPRSYAHRNSG